MIEHKIEVTVWIMKKVIVDNIDTCTILRKEKYGCFRFNEQDFKPVFAIQSVEKRVCKEKLFFSDYILRMEGKIISCKGNICCEVLCTKVPIFTLIDSPVSYLLGTI